MVVNTNKPIHRLKAVEYRWLAVNKCKHGHSYLEHYKCYLLEHQHEERVGFFDIETSDLEGDVGFLLCYAIKEAGKDTIFSKVIDSKEFAHGLDKKITEACVKDMLRFDHLIGYYSTNFDMPFIRTRALRWGIPFPLYGSRTHTDIYFLVRNKLRLSRNTLEKATRLCCGKTRKTRFSPEQWVKTMLGEKESVEYTLKHCVDDVLDTEDLYNKIIDFGRDVRKSI